MKGIKGVAGILVLLQGAAGCVSTTVNLSEGHVAVVFIATKIHKEQVMPSKTSDAASEIRHPIFTLISEVTAVAC